MKNRRGITLISLVITIVILVILSSVGIYLSIGNNGILNKAEQAKNETIKQTATEKMNLKITNMQIEKYAKEQRMPTLQEFADGLCEDDEIQYVQLQSKKVGSLSKIEVGEAESIFTKLKEYPYEFEINSSLQLASIDGEQTGNGLSTGNVGYKVLFNGVANENSKEYELTDSIENYNFLIVEGNVENGVIYETNTMTIPIINMEYCKRDYYLLSGIDYRNSYGWNIQFSFSNANKLYVCYTGKWDIFVPRITKIIGIKMPEI